MSQIAAWRLGVLAIVLSAIFPAWSTAAERTDDADGPGSSHRAFVETYCSSCHNDRVKRGGLVLTSLDVDHVSPDAAIWEKVIHKLRPRYMPPVGRERPDEGTYDQFVSYLETELDREASRQPNPGRTAAFHRLNRTEYRNAIRDLLALDVDVSSLLPKDEESHGFDNVNVGGVTPSLLERYLGAAQKISRLAVGSPVPSPSAQVVELPGDLTQEEQVDGLPFGTRGGTLVHHTFPRDGVYEIQVQLMRSDGESIDGLNDPHEIELLIDGEQLEVFPVRREGAQRAAEPNGSEPGGKQEPRVRVAVTAGPHQVGAAFLKNPSALLETDRQPYQAAFNPLRHPRPQPALFSVSIVGPFEDHGAGSTPSRERIFVCRPASASEEDPCARRILSTLMRRAYRRPVAEADLEASFAFYQEGKAEDGFEAGIELALRSILMNPEFLFRIVKDPAGVAPQTPYRLSDLELASRLSFFLWSSIPDQELLAVAESGTLHQPAVLERQVRRMLADRRSAALAANFAGQWLYVRNLESASPDPRLFPDFDDNLRQALRRETELFFASIVADDRPVLELLTANYTFLNERLARHYEVPNVYGSRFRRVTFPEGSLRGGLLGQGSVLTVTSYAHRTSPVLRGKWILENILGTPPPPPPGNVPALQEGASGTKVLPMRERMAEHRTNPACSGCHNLMDPLGFATESFDAVGRLRTRDESGRPIDASGGLPDGSEFNGIDGLREALLRRPELFVSTVSEKMLIYAVGRGLEHYDAPAVREIVRRARHDDYRFSSLVLATVESAPFQMRRSE